MALTPLLALKLALVPFVVWLASLAARRWGHTISGYLGGLPMIGGPITLYLALDHGAAFATQSALMTLAAVAGQAGHLLAFSAVGRSAGAFPALAAGWGTFALVSLAVASLTLSPMAALLLAAAGLLAASRWLPRPHDAATLPAIPRFELWLRLMAAFALAVALLLGAASLGPTVSGILLSLPITGSILPPFTLQRYGPGGLARLLHGFVTGLTGFVAFFFTVSVSLAPLGIAAAFSLATIAAIVAVAVFSRRRAKTA